MSLTDSPVLLAGSSLLLLAFVKIATTYINRRSLKNLQGPASPSFWIGNEFDIRFQKEVGDCEFKWMHDYGTAWRTAGCMGEDYLMLADPKACQYILHTSGYHYPKRKDNRAISRFVTGDGIIWVEGADHQRHRKVMNPAFGGAQLKSFVSLFHRTATKVLAQKWRDDVIANDESGAPVINVTKWLSHMTLDVIGEAGFGYQFNSLDDSKSALSAVYKNLFIDSTLYPSKADLVFKSMWRYLPDDVVNLFRYVPMKEYSRFRHYLDFIRGVGRDFIANNEAGDGKDILSILLRANKSENAKTRLSDIETVDQISSLLLAGHDTTAFSVTWLLWELAKHPEYQAKVREELAAVRADVTARGDTEFSVADLDGLSMLIAVMKEGLRLHPIVWGTGRYAERDDVIPLAYPITTKTGERISSIPISKGQIIQISIASYNRLPEVWGEDVDSFRPERFLEKENDSISLGVYANLLNFSGGLRGCIGWRFSVLEMQTMLATLLENFEFALPDNADEMKILRKPTGMMVPMVDGQPRLGAWMGLKVTNVAQ
ncbi:cytochrome P450 [Stereum hirsutum FP-91666 SS1]|uniref:cytochrome P450 n=1 Tax=Stereum hirsutum (strain FP-91666) TaxID=721885 RepID=UPI000440CBE6|nr:cytochrome P450 [Stereum hirsutum FP-91666 SS1]EIM91061.1 cytochrome P450 [Stereum hirsutum FP-91666 SS1]